MDNPAPKDLVAFLQEADRWVGDEFDLGELQAGDRLLVRTQNTDYLFLMTGNRTAELTPDRPDKPRGSVRIQGCVFGMSKSIKPDHLFCGGGLEVLFDGQRHPFVTTAIEAIQVVRRSRPAGA